MRITVEVRKEHIEQGLCGSPSGCPVNLAIEAQLPRGFVGLTDGDSVAIYRGPDFIERVMLPYWVRTFIAIFDRKWEQEDAESRRAMSPFSFPLDLPLTLPTPPTIGTGGPIPAV